jgi:colanic acid biosynthesis glycosyl transferase WcaI
MNILTYGINFYPELTGIGKYTGEMCFELAKNHEVTMITTYPYYPHWKVQKGYKNNWWKKEQINNVSVIRCPFYVPNEVTSKNRILHEFSFLVSSCFTFFRQLFKPIDVVVCVVTPFHLGIPARIFSWIKGVPMVYHIQDLQVDAAKDLGMIKNKKLLSFLEKLEKWILTKTDIITTISSGMIDKVKGKKVDAEKIKFFPNWVDSSIIYPMSKAESLKSELGFSETDKIVLYSGNLGEKQGLDQILEVADTLIEDKSLKFAIVGEGGIKEKLVREVKERNLSNIQFFPLQPYEKLSALLAMADLHLVLQKKLAADLVMPSKLTSILAVGGCAIVTASEGTTLHDVMSNHDLGFIIEPEDLDILKLTIQKAVQTDLSEYENNARKYAEQFLDKKAILNQFETELELLVKQNK